MNTTKMNEFKTALYGVKDTFTKDDIESYTLVKNIDDNIKRLLDDELMMKPKNRYTFAERTNAAKANLFEDLALLLAEEAGNNDEFNFFEKAKTIINATRAKGFEIRSEQI